MSKEQKRRQVKLGKKIENEQKSINACVCY